MRPCFADWGAPAYSSPSNAITIVGPNGLTWHKDYGPQPPSSWGGGGSSTNEPQPGDETVNTGLGSVDCQGAITATVTWSGADVPKCVILKETVTVSWGGSSGNCDPGLGGPPPGSGSGTSGSITGTRYSAQPVAGGKASCSASPTAHGSLPAPYGRLAKASASVNYKVEVIPVEITITGTTPLDNGLCVLTGQQLTAELSAGGFPIVTSTTPVVGAHPSWSFASGGDLCFGDWITPNVYIPNPNDPNNDTVISQGKSEMVPIDYNVGLFKFYTKKQGMVKVSVSARVQFPDFTTGDITAETRDVTSIRPTVTQWQITDGSVVFFTDRFKAQLGQSWDAIISLAAPFSGTGGTGAYCQLSTPKRSMGTATAGVSYSIPLYGLEGLDGQHPYVGHEFTDLTAIRSNDNPGQGAPATQTYGDQGNFDYILSSKAEDSFVTYLMFKPNPAPTAQGQLTQWVPLQKYTWSWGAEMTRPNASSLWTNHVIQQPHHDPKTEEYDHPIWLRKHENNWNWVRSQ